MRERNIIDWIRRQGDFRPEAVPVGPGDDCAIVRCGSERVLITTDQVLDGVHFRLAEHGPAAAGRKAMARNLSDFAAMAARPISATATVALPKGSSDELAKAVYRGLRESADVFRVDLVGGDIAAWDAPLAISVTVIGRPAGVSGRIEPVLRSGARAGDAVCVTGELGGAWRTDRHLTFTPRVGEAVALALKYRLRSMIDISDGLATDLHHICRASGVGAEINAADVPVHADAIEHTDTPADALLAALTDGEDYELLFTLPKRQAKKLCEQDRLPIKVTRIGTIVSGGEVLLVRPDGRREELTPDGWEHKT